MLFPMSIDILVILESETSLTFWTVLERTPNVDQGLHLVLCPLSPNQNWPTSQNIINVFVFDIQTIKLS